MGLASSSAFSSASSASASSSLSLLADLDQLLGAYHHLCYFQISTTIFKCKKKLELISLSVLFRILILIEAHPFEGE